MFVIFYDVYLKCKIIGNEIKLTLTRPLQEIVIQPLYVAFLNFSLTLVIASCLTLL